MKEFYRRVGLKVGLEIHQQLNTKHKLFCNCLTTMKEKEPIMIVKRKLFPVVSELGEYDPAAKFEWLRDRTFFYKVYKKESCAVELDEEPPRPLNKEALEIAMEIALLLNCKLVNEVHVMRKTVIDGSNTTGFQRTAVIGFDGWIDVDGRKVKIEQICLEEDSCSLEKEENGNVYFRLNRLGIPLVEISTGILENITPDEVEKIALRIGSLLRLTGKVKRGLGSIRQDINVSIEKGARVEIKGIQRLELISRVIELEVKRQLSLLKIIEEIRKRNAKVEEKIYEVTRIFRGTSCKFLNELIKNGYKVYAIKLKGFSNLLKFQLHEKKSLGKEFAQIVETFGVKGILHTDENLEKYGIEKERISKLKERLGATEKDCIIIVAEKRSKGRAIKFLQEKIKRLCEGKLEGETRVAKEDGSTKFARPLPGAARMYPETDVPPISIKQEMIEKIRKKVPNWNRIRNEIEQMDLPKEFKERILLSKYLFDFLSIVRTYKIKPKLVANFFLSTVRELKREGFNIEEIGIKKVYRVFELLAEKKITKEAIFDIVAKIVKEKDKSVEEVIDELSLWRLPYEQVLQKVREIIEKNRCMKKNKLFGVIMKQLRGKASVNDVKKAFEILLKE